jgi:hypothetical protein
VVDAANVVGSVPDGWWRDRAGATARLLDRLAPLSADGVDAARLGLPGSLWFPEVVASSRVRRATSRMPRWMACIVRAPDAGDDAIVAEAGALIDAGKSVTVVTSDRALRGRVEELGATVTARVAKSDRGPDYSPSSRPRSGRSLGVPVWWGARRRDRARRRGPRAPAPECGLPPRGRPGR